MPKRSRKFKTRSRATKHALREGIGQVFRRKRSQKERAPTGADRTYVGEVQKNTRGFAFILPQKENIPDIYLSPDEAQGLVDGDLIEFRIRRRGPRLNGQVRRVLKRTRTKAFGTLSQTGKHWVLRTREGDWYQVRTERSRLLSPGWAIGTIDRYPSPIKPGLVSITEYLGRRLEPRHDGQITIAHFGLNDEFPEAVLGEAFECRRLKPEPGARRDQRSLPFVTIDGEDAKDFDDAIYVQGPTRETAFTLYVAIADVSFYVRPNSALDAEARARGTSVYFPGYVIPMLPEVLSNDLCSLRPHAERLALTAQIRFDRQGEPIGADFYESIIQTHARLTYAEVQNFWDGDPKAAGLLARLQAPLMQAKSLYQLLRKKRKERGVLDFDLPEAKVLLDPAGRPVGISPAPRYESHKLIEEFMIAANRAVAKALKESQTIALYRVHETPKESSLAEINELLRNFGVSLEMKDLSPASFAHILENTSSLKQAGTLHQFILRMQKQARYQAYPLGHFGLALEDYTHFTSPIRRYPDLVVHRALKQLIFNTKSSDKEDDQLSEMERISEETSNRERKAMEAERFIVRRKQCWFMKERLGEVFSGRVAGIISRGAFVEIPQFSIEGLVPIESLGVAYFFDEHKHCLRRRPGHHTISIGDPMTVQVVGVSIDDHEITFGPA